MLNSDNFRCSSVENYLYKQNFEHLYTLVKIHKEKFHTLNNK
jgi:hypothetical protein